MKLSSAREKKEEMKIISREESGNVKAWCISCEISAVGDVNKYQKAQPEEETDYQRKSFGESG